MRFLADENFPRVAVTALEKAGHDIVWIRIVAPGATDPQVLSLATRERRILLTFDKDFGELAAHSPVPAGCGIVLLRLPVPNSEAASERLATQIGARQDWDGHFSVIEPARVRMRRLTLR
jgi:predicted nuclease of predicted toxin-antitoxin system